MSKPLAKALHTVTVVVAVAAHIRGSAPNSAPEQYTRAALKVLGYTKAQCDASPDLFAKCVDAVRKSVDA